MTATDENDESPKGVFLTKGMQLSISEFSLTINPDGTIGTSNLSLAVGLDMCPHWLDIALTHLLSAREASVRTAEAHRTDDADERGVALQNEFVAGMQSIVACTTAIDALYANIKDRANIPDDLVKTWRDNRTARHKQVSETLRRAFKINGDELKKISSLLKHAYSFRDRAVHPAGGTSNPAQHPELKIVSEWRFVAYRYRNAYNLFNGCYSLITSLLNPNARKLSDAMETYRGHLHARLEPIVARWSQDFENSSTDS